jgi:putative transposase
LKPSEKREAASYLVATHDLSVKRSCASVQLSRTAYYQPPRDRRQVDVPVVDTLNRMVEKHPRWGFWKCFDRMRLDGCEWNHKRVYRVYRAMRLNLPRRTKRRLPVRERQTLEVAARPNAIWSLDFMSDALFQGKRFRTLNVLDEGVREALDIVIDTSIPSGRVVRALDQLGSIRGLPEAIRCDNGPELTSEIFQEWCSERGIEIRYIQPGKPNQNAYIERFNRTYREEILNAYLFATLEEVREITEEWLEVYNERRPHDALGRVPPSVFRRTVEPDLSTYAVST